MNDQQHEMVLEKTHSSGAEEWCCPTCGRRFLVQWPPAFTMLVLEPGDQNARHSGSTGPIRMGPPQANQVKAIGFTEQLRLDPWIKWLDQVDFDNWWGRDI